MAKPATTIHAWLTAAEACDLIGCHRSTLWRLVSGGDVAYRGATYPGIRRYLRRDVERIASAVPSSISK